MTRDLWLEAHSYLRPVADLSAQVDRAADGIDVLDARMPDWDDYRLDFLAGVPLLSSADAADALRAATVATRAALAKRDGVSVDEVHPGAWGAFFLLGRGALRL